MKLLLTSAGITNASLKRALTGLVDGKIRIAFIPTAANTEEGTKEWLIDNYNQCRRLGTVDIVDVSAVSRDVWLPRLKRANVIFVGGGKPVHLMKCVARSGLQKALPGLLRSRVYVGISAGSIITAKTLASCAEFIFKERHGPIPAGLGYIDFNIRPHLGSRHFPNDRPKTLERVSKRLEGDLYSIDDHSGILCANGKITVISEGRWKKYGSAK